MPCAPGPRHTDIITKNSSREGSKGQMPLNFKYKVNLKGFLYRNLCVFSQIKDLNRVQKDI